MSVQAFSWVIEKSQHGGSALLVLLMIANYARPDGTDAFPSLQTLADDARMSRRAVQYIVDRKLLPSGELVVQRRTRREDGAGGGRHSYELPGVVRDGFHVLGAKIARREFTRPVEKPVENEKLRATCAQPARNVGERAIATDPRTENLELDSTIGADAPLPSRPVQNTQKQTRSERDRIDAEIEHHRKLAARDRRLDREQEVRREAMVGCGPEPAYAAEAQRRIAELAKVKAL